MPAVSGPAGSIRARVRAEMIDEIKVVARRHLATDGANLSLRAVARDMGMVSSALYRYFPSRDDLLTALILDGYNALADVISAADTAVTDRCQLRARWLAVARAVRGWALAKPSEYALLYGSPVPGYAAPQDTAVAATRSAAVFIGILADGYASGALAGAGGGQAPGGAGTDGTPRPASPPVPQPRTVRLARAVRADLTRVAEVIAPGLPEEILMAGFIAWIHLFGAVSFELFGQLNNVIEARAEFFDQQLEQLADLVGF